MILAILALSLASPARAVVASARSVEGVRALGQAVDLALRGTVPAARTQGLPPLPATALAADPRMAALLERIEQLAPAPERAGETPARPAADAPAAESYRTLSVVSTVLAPYTPQDIMAMPAEALGALSGRVWERLAGPTGSAAEASAPIVALDRLPPRRARSSGVERYDKLFVSLRYYLQGAKYFTALKALNFARQRHTGTRKDGVTPEFQHQIEIALFITTLSGVRDPEKALTVALLHDVMEDYDVSREEMEREFGAEITRVVEIVTKIKNGVPKDPETYFGAIAADPTASLVKGADRIHNVQSMVGVFSRAKQKEYIEEVERWFLPMIKAAKYNFPDQTPAYFNIQHMLKSQLELLEKARKRGPRARPPKSA